MSSAGMWGALSTQNGHAPSWSQLLNKCAHYLMLKLFEIRLRLGRNQQKMLSNNRSLEQIAGPHMLYFKD